MEIKKIFIKKKNSLYFVKQPIVKIYKPISKQALNLLSFYFLQTKNRVL